MEIDNKVRKILIDSEIDLKRHSQNRKDMESKMMFLTNKNFMLEFERVKLIYDETRELFLDYQIVVEKLRKLLTEEA